MFSFVGFRTAVEQRVASMHVVALTHPDDDWPATLFAEAPEQSLRLVALWPTAGLEEAGKHHLVAELIPASLEQVNALKAALLLPSYSLESQPCELLTLLVADDQRAQARLATVARSETMAPRLGAWSTPTQRVEGRFATALLEPLAALAARRPPCPDCAARAGRPHEEGCDVEVCTVCGGQRMLCTCPGHDSERAAWAGEWPGVAECRERGWYARRAYRGWMPCAPGEPGARPDLNRLAFFRAEGWDGLYAGHDPSPSL